MDKLEKAQKLLRERGAAWFAGFLYDGEYSLQCGGHYLMLEEGDPSAGEPPWAYAMSDIDIHVDKLSDCAVEYPLGECDTVYLDFKDGDTQAWTLRSDRFVDEGGVEYAVNYDGDRLTDLPGALLEYAGE